MKLIIDIPEDDFKKFVNPYQHNEIWCNRLKRIVMNGTPLDSVIEEERNKYNDIALDLLGEVEHYEKAIEDIKAEIKQKAWDTQEIDGEHENYKVVDLSDVLQILDNIGRK